MKRCLALALFFACSLACAFGIDREAFTVTRYDLDVQIDRETHVIAVTGKLNLRNDSKSPQKLAVLQVSSSLAWNGIAINDTAVPFLGQNYTSDIDHTGSLSEAIVTLPAEVSPGKTITLDVQYGGTIIADATRLTRMGVPQDVALRNDWDQISNSFTAVRGLGYVVWYPVALDAASMSDGNAVFDAIARWKQRHSSTAFGATIHINRADAHSVSIITNQTDSLPSSTPRNDSMSPHPETAAELTLASMGNVIPAFVAGDFVELTRPSLTVFHAADHTSLARDYALAAEANEPLLNEWLPASVDKARIVDLFDSNASPFQQGPTLLTALRSATTPNLQLLLLSTQVAARFQSSHPWIPGGLGRFLQSVSVEQRSGRRAALELIAQSAAPLAQAEASARSGQGASANTGLHDSDNTLLNTNDELYLRGKASFVLWMLRDMVGESAMQRALTAYRSDADKDPTYLQKLIEHTSKRDLEWFFDDWVYRDRGLPDFVVESAYPRTLLSGKANSFMVTATIENRGDATAEVPVSVQTASGERSTRVLVKAHEKSVARIEVPGKPISVRVNDGSVPEADANHNRHELAIQQQP